MGIQLLAGRTFQASDGNTSPSVTVVSEDFARDYLPISTSPEEMVGQSLEGLELVRSPTTVVGVVGSTRHEGPDAPTFPSVYVPHTQQSVVAFGSLLIDGAVDSVRDAVITIVDRVTPEGEWTPLGPYAAYWDRWFAPFRLQLVVVGTLIVLGLLLASVGLYSLLGYQVLLDRREIGVRKAVGAPDSTLLMAVVGRGMGMAAMGGVIGMIAWYQAVPFARGLVEGIDGAGATVPLTVLLVVGGSSLIATLAPGFKASRMDPVLTLKAD